MAAAVERLMDNSAAWLDLSARQFAIHVGGLMRFNRAVGAGERPAGA